MGLKQMLYKDKHKKAYKRLTVLRERRDHNIYELVKERMDILALRMLKSKSIHGLGWLRFILH